MTAMAIGSGADVPDAIVTLEQGLLHLAMTAEFIYRNETYKELNGDGLTSGRQPLVDISFVTAADGTKRAIIRASIELDPEYVTPTQKLWMYARNWGSTAVPATFKVN